MSGATFEPDDFLVFLDPDDSARLQYMRDELHPRLRDLGERLRDALGERAGTELRCQLRSGRWHKATWGTWVSVVSPQERRRSDPKRPRLMVFIDEREAQAGFAVNIWSSAWEIVTKDIAGFAEAADAAAQGGDLEIAVAHWDQGDRQTLQYDGARAAVAAAEDLGQDWLLVGATYPWPERADLLCSPEFFDDALRVLDGAWPVYQWAFFGESD
ncbi:MAG: hypothetical protein ACE5JM_13320 [Armatimonadota bacterium]